MEGSSNSPGGSAALIVRARVAVLALAAVIASMLAVSVPAYATGTTIESCNKRPSSLQLADTLSSDIGRDGQPVQQTTPPDGPSVPVVVVHGWTGKSIHKNDMQKRDGAFSQPIDLTANRAATASVGRSLIGQLQDVGRTTIYTFDYHDLSARWVTDPGIGQALADALRCVAEVHGTPAVVVAHSMGGLATRQALSILGASGNSAPDIVSDVITFGTPNSGSWVASVVNASSSAVSIARFLPGDAGAAVVAVESLLVACGAATTNSLAPAGACGLLPEYLSSARSEAGKALRVGSPEMLALPAWPQGVTVHALAGSINLEVARFRWFGLTSTSLGSAAVGDFIVGTESAFGGADLNRRVECRYTLDADGALADAVAYRWQLKTANEAREPVSGVKDSACFHGNLMRSIELTNEALGVVADRVDALYAGVFLPAKSLPGGGNWLWELPGYMMMDDGPVTAEFTDARGDRVAAPNSTALWAPCRDVKGQGLQTFRLNYEYSTAVLGLSFDDAHAPEGSMATFNVKVAHAYQGTYEIAWEQTISVTRGQPPVPLTLDVTQAYELLIDVWVDLPCSGGEYEGIAATSVASYVY